MKEYFQSKGKYIYYVFYLATGWSIMGSYSRTDRISRAREVGVSPARLAPTEVDRLPKANESGEENFEV